MITVSGTNEILSWPKKNGWHVCPSTGDRVELGDEVKLGDKVTLGNWVTPGNWVTLGDRVTLGNWVKLGDRVTLGDRVKLGNWVKLGDRVTLGDSVMLGDRVTLGDSVMLGDRVTLGDGETSENLASLFRAAMTEESYTLTKWVTRDRKSPNFDGGTTIHYGVGDIIVEGGGEVSDKQCATGLHVFVRGYRPEWDGLCGADHDYIAIDVRVAREDILFAGLPGNHAKLRVRKLEVLS